MTSYRPQGSTTEYKTDTNEKGAPSGRPFLRSCSRLPVVDVNQSQAEDARGI